MRSSILMNALAVSMEGVDPSENTEINPVTENTSVAVDEVLEEVRDAEDVVEEHDEAVEELEEVAESLESLIVSLESAVRAGGMSPRTADVHSRAMAIAVRRLPVDAAQYTVSTESFGGTGDKLTASQEALQGAKDLLSKIWNAIKTTVQKAWAAVVNFVTTLGKSARSLKKAGNLLKAQSGSMDGTPKVKEIDATALARFLHSDGSLKYSITASLKTVKDNGEKVNTAAKTSVTVLKDLAGTIASGSANSSEQVQGMATIMGKFPSGNMPGGRVIEENDAGIPKLVSKVNLKDEAVKVKTPGKSDVAAIASSIVAIADMIEEYDGKHFKAMQKEINTFITKQDALVKKLEMEKAETAKVRSELQGFKKISTMARSVGPEYMSYAASTAKAAYNFGRKAVAAYGGKAEKVEEEK